MPQKQFIIAHRGFSANFPENTLRSFKEAIKAKAKWIELDITNSREGTLVISHDNNLKRCAHKDILISSLNDTELKNIDVGSWFDQKFKEESIPFLKDVVNLAMENNIGLNIEVKIYEENTYDEQTIIIRELRNVLKKSKIDKNQIIISSFQHEVLQLIKDSLPEFEVACLFNKLNNNWLDIMRKCRAKIIHLNMKYLTDKQIEELHSHDYTINCWTVNDLTEANQLWERGVSGIFTDKINLFDDKYKII